MADKAHIVLGLGFGDEGKGTIVDHLCREHDADRVIRFNGGAQASHAVVLPDGRSHCFHQFGSGTFAGAKTHLSKYMMVNPALIFTENADLINLGIDDALSRLSVHKDAIVTTRFHVATNRMREASRTHPHGSCGLGIGETMQDFLEGSAIFVRDLLKPDVLRGKLNSIRKAKYLACKGMVRNPIPETGEEWAVLDPKLTPHEIDHLIDLYTIFAECVEIRDDDPLDGITIFEGAQGVLLDQDLPSGFQPHTTWSKTTSENALRILEDNHTTPEVTVTGVLRAYMTRHGAGPFPTYSAALTEALSDPHNPENDWQGSLRYGALDLQLLNWAMHYEGMRVDQLAVTCLDQFADDPARVRMPFETGGLTAGFVRHPAMDSQMRYVSPVDLPSLIQEALKRPVAITSYGPTHEDKYEGVMA